MHFLPIRVYYEDTDAGGVVYHANYLKFFERGRTESLRALGFELFSLLSEHNAQFAVHSLEIEFLKFARLDQLLYVVTQVIEVRKASIMYNQQVRLTEKEGQLLCKANIRLACLDSNNRLRAIPESLLMEIKP